MRTATMDIILTPARLTASTDLTGLQVEYLSAPAHGMAGVVAGAGDGAAAVGVMVVAAMDAASTGAVDLHRVLAASVAALLVDFMVAPLVEGSTVAPGFAAAEGSTVAEVEDSTVAAGIVAVEDMVAGTGR